ncbi:MAG: hypothetical protein GY860_21925, partial [Desulfobacteraceae bacterium]|nr:hypothetical protein [Desulfobacteraceae bacterium]
MINLRTSIGKLIVFICFSLLITILPLFLILHGTFMQFGKYAYTTNARQIKDISHSSLSAIATAQAQKYNEIFTRIKVAASLLALASTDIYSSLDLLSQMPLEATPFVKQEPNQIFFTPPSHPIVKAFWGNTKISPAIDKEIKALSHLGPYLKATRELIHESIATHVITESGIGLYCTTNPRVKNQYFNLPPAKEY